MRAKYLACLLSGAMLAGVTASADTLSIADKLNSGAVVPQRGMTMEMVESRFGLPKKQNLPVGSPPITRWIYDGFRVYFENHYVIHAVAD